MIAGLKSYPATKDSGVPWLGMVPEHWEVVPLSRALTQRKEKNDPIKTTDILSLSLDTGVIPYAEKKAGGNKAKEDLSAYMLAYPGDIVVNSMNVVVGSVGLSKYFGAVSPVYYMLRAREEDDLVEYFEAIFQDVGFQRSLFGLGNGIMFIESRSSGKLNTIRLRLPMTRLKKVVLPYPAPGEQVAIVRFLDHVDRRIRRYIRVKEKLITLLEEQKQAIIHRAVTRGLAPNVRLKPSGVEWLGEVPEHWEIRRLKSVTQLQRGYDLPADQRIPGPFPVVSSGGFIDTHSESRCTAPGVVMGRYGSTDAIFFVEKDFWPHNTSLFVTDFHGNAQKWCYYLLSTITKADHAGKSAVPGLDRKDLFQIVVPVPPLAEQRETVKGIERATCALMDAISALKQETVLVREFRTRLIADVVTGSLDVREAAARLPDEAEEPEPLDEAEVIVNNGEEEPAEVED